ncbi:SurA N-terminal domain-containing protein [Amphibiibacter pelophylacis]|uniref:SurA N-terminal domain-containing protein n=1 Tax=Amphibiibacter pelophylacis TaxID=1799477 RepID=A0ACC6P0N0_9BURK
MFDFVRNHKRLMQFLLLLAVVPSFVLVGVEGYSSMSGSASATVAEVGKAKITRTELDAAHQQQVNAARAQMPNLDAALFDTPEMLRQTLDGLVRQQVLAQAAQDQHLAVDDARLVRLFASDPQLAAVRKPDGRLDDAALAARGMNAALLEQQLRQEYTLRQVIDGVQETAFATPALTDLALKAYFQGRAIEFQRFDLQQAQTEVQPTAQQLADYFKKNSKTFQQPAQAQIEYVLLDQAAVMSKISVSDADIQKAYDSSIEDYRQPEERHLRHILIAVPEGASDAVKKAAHDKAQKLLDELKAHPDRFEALAKANSQDPGSAQSGGDLGFVAKGVMVPAFEKAAFALKKGETSGIVTTEFGDHIIRVDDIRGGEVQPLSAVRTQIENTLRTTRLSDAYNKAMDQMDTLLKTGPADFTELAKTLGLTVNKATVTPQPAPGATGVLAEMPFLRQVFSPEVLESKTVSAGFDVKPGEHVAVRVLSHSAQRPQTQAEAAPALELAVRRELAQAKVKTDAEALLATLKSNPAQALPSKATVSRREPSGFALPVVERLLALPASPLPHPFTLDMPGVGYVTGRITAVTDTPLPPAEKAQLTQSLVRLRADAQAQAFYDDLKTRYKVKVFEDQLKAAAPAPAAAP